jgi:hypothetical protein
LVEHTLRARLATPTSTNQTALALGWRRHGPPIQKSRKPRKHEILAFSRPLPPPPPAEGYVASWRELQARPPDRQLWSPPPRFDGSLERRDLMTLRLLPRADEKRKVYEYAFTQLKRIILAWIMHSPSTRRF